MEVKSLILSLVRRKKMMAKAMAKEIKVWILKNRFLSDISSPSALEGVDWLVDAEDISLSFGLGHC
jgi:hypothetical protein